MKILLEKIIPHYIEYDLLQYGGKKTKDSYFLIQYFDLVLNGQREFAIPDRLEKPYLELFKQLEIFAKKKKTLAEQGIWLFMKEAYDTCNIILSLSASKNEPTTSKFRREFAKKEWANVEDLLLDAGFAVVKKTELRTMNYALPALRAKYEIVINNENSNLIITAPDEDMLIESLTVIGHSLDEGKFIDSDSYQPNKNAPGRRGT